MPLFIQHDWCQSAKSLKDGERGSYSHFLDHKRPTRAPRVKKNTGELNFKNILVYFISQTWTLHALILDGWKMGQTLFI